jgi:hypothetical protein
MAGVGLAVGARAVVDVVEPRVASVWEPPSIGPGPTLLNSGSLVGRAGASRVGSGPFFRAEDHFASLSRVLKVAKNRLQHAVYYYFLRPKGRP